MTTMITARVDSQKCKTAEKKFSEVELTTSAAVNLFICAVTMHGGIPFQIGVKPVTASGHEADSQPERHGVRLVLRTASTHSSPTLTRSSTRWMPRSLECSANGAGDENPCRYALAELVNERFRQTSRCTPSCEYYRVEVSMNNGNCFNQPYCLPTVKRKNNETKSRMW